MRRFAFSLFASVYFLSFLQRVAISVVAGALEAEFGLDSVALGMMSRVSSHTRWPNRSSGCWRTSDRNVWRRAPWQWGRWVHVRRGTVSAWFSGKC